MGVLAVLTVVCLLAIAGFVWKISRAPVQVKPVALTGTTHHSPSSRPAPSGQAPSGSPSPQPGRPSSAAERQVTDAATGLSYRLLPSPWQAGCPGVLRTPVFSWSAGEHAVAGTADIGGTAIDWHGNACSGQLPPAFSYSGPADLAPVTMAVASATDPAYYAGLAHDRTLGRSTALRVSGHQAWLVTFLVNYPHAASDHLAWTSEAGAVVVVDRGPALLPAVFYASIPSNLGHQTITTLLDSLRLASPGPANPG
jgi:hypothetical protein